MSVIGIRLSDLRKQSVDKPSMWQVIFANDPVTPVDFVEEMIVKYFNKTAEEAKAIISFIEKYNEGSVGVFTREVAETKQKQVLEDSANHGYGLQCRIEKV